MIESTFTTPLGFYDYKKTIHQSEYDFIHNLKYTPNIHNTISESKTLLDHDELKRLAFFFKTSLADYIRKTINPPDTVRHYITHCWANKTNVGESHHRHTHPNSIVSGVFYLNTVKDRDAILFYKERDFGIMPVLPDKSQMTAYNSYSYRADAIPKRLVLFPSTLEHEVEVVQGDLDTRISIAFNTFVTGAVNSGIGDDSHMIFPPVNYG